MKPTKNRVYCYDCGRHKMLFNDEKKADNFIKFHHDSDEFGKGYVPKRSYFCTVCGGWHVTSLETRDEERIPLSKQLIHISINQHLERINEKTKLRYADGKMSEVAKLLKCKPVDFDTCERLLNEAYHDIQSTADTLYKESLMARYRKQKKQLVKYAPDQLELKRNISSILKKIEKEMERSESLETAFLFQSCKNLIGELNNSQLKSYYLNTYHKLKVMYYAKIDPSKLNITTKSEQKIVRMICERYIDEYEWAFACNEYHICTINIQKVVSLYDILSKVCEDDKMVNILNWINNNLIKLSAKITATQQLV